MGVITLLTGGGPLVLITSVVPTVLVSILLLWLYRRAFHLVAGGLRASGGFYGTSVIDRSWHKAYNK
jgi:hypothetical protein